MLFTTYTPQKPCAAVSSGTRSCSVACWARKPLCEGFCSAPKTTMTNATMRDQRFKKYNHVHCVLVARIRDAATATTWTGLHKQQLCGRGNNKSTHARAIPCVCDDGDGVLYACCRVSRVCARRGHTTTTNTLYVHGFCEVICWRPLAPRRAPLWPPKQTTQNHQYTNDVYLHYSVSAWWACAARRASSSH